jgi:hypothetical protein
MDGMDCMMAESSSFLAETHATSGAHIHACIQASCLLTSRAIIEGADVIVVAIRMEAIERLVVWTLGGM